MPGFEKFVISETQQFVPSQFSELEPSLQQVLALLSKEPSVPKTEMLLSFVKDHSINAELVKQHPKMAKLISSGTVPLRVMEDLFESSGKNPLFRKELEEYIRAYIFALNRAGKEADLLL